MSTSALTATADYNLFDIGALAQTINEYRQAAEGSSSDTKHAAAEDLAAAAETLVECFRRNAGLTSTNDTSPTVNHAWGLAYAHYEQQLDDQLHAAYQAPRDQATESRLNTLLLQRIALCLFEFTPTVRTVELDWRDNGLTPLVMRDDTGAVDTTYNAHLAAIDVHDWTTHLNPRTAGLTKNSHGHYILDLRPHLAQLAALLPSA
ncbi:hypothetical protein [Nocardia salmonicida]|uniref:hypothetical protein n=1 Tax=Nocardia salmonicida TaxID=53431 RepID=UPI0007A3AB9A|nr:hypothetical protein [Nocardia salmonicida]MBC7299832.1 hypothetical protein [Nocardia sp.]